MDQKIIVHKKNTKTKDPLVSIILLDWSVRERFYALDWLNKQDAPRDEYELIWVELYDRVVPEAIEKADTVITCGQKGIYSKHKGLNIIYLHHARGQIVTNCDSDAVFPPNFISSIINSFRLTKSGEFKPLVLMHDEFRNNKISYPDGIPNIEEVKGYPWLPLWKNMGACTSFRKIDVIRFGGWDEHKSFRGLSGGGDLPWRLINAGLPQIWHDNSAALYHFAHPHPEVNKIFSFSLKMWEEIASPYIHGAPFLAVESFATGRLLPIKENPEIHKLRLSLREIDSEGERKLGNLSIPIDGFSKIQKTKIYLNFYKYKLSLLKREGVNLFIKSAKERFKNIIGDNKYNEVKKVYQKLLRKRK